MQEFFDPCVDNVIELIEKQNLQVEQKHNRVKVSSSMFPNQPDVLI